MRPRQRQRLLVGTHHVNAAGERFRVDTLHAVRRGAVDQDGNGEPDQAIEHEPMPVELKTKLAGLRTPLE